MNSVRLPLLLCLATCLLSGCVTKKDQTAVQKPEAEYVWYTPTGSNIPVRIKKSEVQASDSATQATQDALRDVQKRGAVEHRSD